MSGVLIETDVLADFLTAAPGAVPLLRRLLQVVPCYTTFVQAAELYAAAETPGERELVTRVLYLVRILGAHPRYSVIMGQALSSLAADGGLRTAIVAGIALEARLPIVTRTHYRGLLPVSGLQLFDASELSHTRSLEALTNVLSGSS